MDEPGSEEYAPSLQDRMMDSLRHSMVLRDINKPVRRWNHLQTRPKRKVPGKVRILNTGAVTSRSGRSFDGSKQKNRSSSILKLKWDLEEDHGTTDESRDHVSLSRNHYHSQRSLAGAQSPLTSSYDDANFDAQERSSRIGSPVDQHTKAGYALFNLKHHPAPLKSEKQILRDGNFRNNSIAARVLAFARVPPKILEPITQSNVLSIQPTKSKNGPNISTKPRISLVLPIDSTNDANRKSLRTPNTPQGRLSLWRDCDNQQRQNSRAIQRQRTSSITLVSPAISVRPQNGFNLRAGLAAVRRFKKRRKKKVKCKLITLAITINTIV